jgi:hypothetical protein
MRYPLRHEDLRAYQVMGSNHRCPKAATLPAAAFPLCQPGGEDDGTRTRNGLAHNQAPQPFGSSSVRNQGLEPRTGCVWSSRSAAELIALEHPRQESNLQTFRFVAGCAIQLRQGGGGTARDAARECAEIRTRGLPADNRAL